MHDLITERYLYFNGQKLFGHCFIEEFRLSASNKHYGGLGRMVGQFPEEHMDEIWNHNWSSVFLNDKYRLF